MPPRVADAMHAILIGHADQLASSIDGAADVTEYMVIVSAITAYEGGAGHLGKSPAAKASLDYARRSLPRQS